MPAAPWPSLGDSSTQLWSALSTGNFSELELDHFLNFSLGKEHSFTDDSPSQPL